MLDECISDVYGRVAFTALEDGHPAFDGRGGRRKPSVKGLSMRLYHTCLIVALFSAGCAAEGAASESPVEQTADQEEALPDEAPAWSPAAVPALAVAAHRLMGPLACRHTAILWAFDEEHPPWTFVGFWDTDWASPDTGGAIDIQDVAAGDMVIVDAHAIGDIATPYSGIPAELRLVGWQTTGNGAAAGAVPLGARAVIDDPGMSNIAIGALIEPVVDGPIRIGLQGKVGVRGDVLRLQAAASLRATHVRCDVQ